ncbi:MAG: NAD(+)/NADH kinase [Clostridiales bacterium]|nr:NAD(+)/NADH kinase [Clostridiales bacterium]
MNISVFSALDTKERSEITHRVLSTLNSLGCRLYVSKRIKDEFALSYCRAVPDGELAQRCDIAVAIGGDGTIVKVAKNAAINGKAVLGINGGRLGFLSGLEKDEISYLKKLVSGEYKIDERIMLRADVYKADELIRTYHSLNDVVFSRGDFNRLIDIQIDENSRKLMNVRADGVIFSTPTGSTAYSLAAGGPVLSPELNCFVITSICAHSITQRSIVVNSSGVLEVNIKSDVSNNAILTSDGDKPFEIPEGAKTLVSLSPYTARLIKIKPDNFYEILTKKLIDR